MKCKYLIDDREIWIEVISLEDPRIDDHCAKSISASALLNMVKTNQISRILLTSTYPIIYLRMATPYGGLRFTYSVKYRLFLSFATNLLSFDDEPEEPDWFRYGF